MNKLKLIISSASAAILTIIFVVVVTIWAEFSVPFKDWLKNFSGNHWTSKSIFSVILYVGILVILYVLPQQNIEDRLKKILQLLLAFTIVGIVVLSLFYTGHHFKIF